MKFCSDLGHGEHWFVTVRPKNVDQGGWLHRDANFRLKMEFKRNGEEYSFNIFKLLWLKQNPQTFLFKIVKFK